MLTLTLTPLFTPRLSNFSTVNPFKETKKKKKKVKKARCRADLSGDAPFVVAVGACMLSSLLLPNGNDPDEESGTGYSGLDSTDTRLAAMGVISFIPYFNWLSWVFAWLDTGKRRYAVYALVYLAPYLRSNLSLSPEESWLPIASIVAGIIHVQLEASIRNGDIQGFQLFSEASKLFSKAKIDTDLEGHYGTSMEGGREEHTNLLPTEDQSRKEVEEREVPRTPSERSDTSNGDWYDDDHGGGGGRRH